MGGVESLNTSGVRKSSTFDFFSFLCLFFNSSFGTRVFPFFVMVVFRDSLLVIVE